jgi:light-regulated signal transduction histidine kinase (bacteriophytochrome)
MEKYCEAVQVTDDNTAQRMLFACWIAKSTDTYSECVILNALPWQKLLRESASMLRYTYIDCLLKTNFRLSSL